MVTLEREWNLEYFERDLPREVLLYIAGIHPPKDDAGEDQIAWRLTDNGKCTVASGYNKFAHEQCRRGMADCHFCDLCGSGVETPLHAVRDCLVARNVWLFNGEFGEASIEVTGIIAFAKSVMLTNNRKNQQNDPAMSFASWQPPPSDWCKLNTDGSRYLITSQASARELWTIMDGLDIAWKRGVKQFLVENDCLIAVNMLNGQIKGTEGSLVRIVRELLARNWHVKVMFTPRTTNMAADSMAALRRNVSLGLRIYDVPLR
ncbi:hypothetical protein V6Z11_D13G113400 [Gossypium hirsutum]